MELKEVKQIEDGLYSFISGIDVDHVPWNLEYFPNSKERMFLFKGTGYPKEVEKYIGGGYKAEYQFNVFIQGSRKDTKNKLDLTRYLYAVNEVFEREQELEFPNLKLDDAIPCELQMITTPSDYTVEGQPLSRFYCSFRLTYEKKGKFE